MEKVGKSILRSLILALLAVTLLVSAAHAAEANSMQSLQDRINANDGNIVLTDDIVITQTINIESSKNVSIDLNGHTIARGENVGVLFNVNGKLTITDSRNVTASESVATAPSRDNDTADGTGIAIPATISNGTLTYYESRSAVNPDGISTTETRYKVSVDVGSMGGVTGSSSTSSLFNVTGSNAVLNIEGGAFSNANGRVIEASSGATLNLTGGYFYGSSITNGRGGAVYASGWSGNVTVNIGGAQGKKVVFAGNSAPDGGALGTEGSVAVNIHDGAVFSGNKATGSGRNGGGAIFIGYNSNAVMDGGLITNNWGVDNSNYEAGGGGILVHGTLLMTDGQVTHNEAEGGGGISTYFWEGGTLTIRGGIIAGNVARKTEGGGITVNMNGSATIVGSADNPTYVTNNATETNQHWGGGGIFGANDSTVRMLSLIVTDNEAGGFGGGLAGCSTGRIDTHAISFEEHSIALYGNSAEGVHLSGDESTKSEDRVYAANDPVFMREGDYYQDYFCALNSTLCPGMLGGGEAKWIGTVDGREIAYPNYDQNSPITSQYITGMTGYPTDEDVSNALTAGRVFVTGNSSGTHGGGILINGIMIIGTEKEDMEVEIGDRMTIKGYKTLDGGTINDKFKFIVTDNNGNQITTATSQGNSEIHFQGRIPFDAAGTYTFWIYESNDNPPSGVTMDPTRYRMVVTVVRTTGNTSVPSVDDPTQMEDVLVKFDKISEIQIYKHTSASDTTGTLVEEYTDISSENRTAYELPFTFEFVNSVATYGSLQVRKTVSGDAANSNDLFTFTVTLEDSTISGTFGDMTFANGVATFQLKGGESITATGLPAGIDYTVEEASSSYTVTVPENATGTIAAGSTAEVEFVNTKMLERGGLTVKKSVEGDGANKDKAFSFTVTLGDSSINGTYGGMTFVNGVASFQLKDGESVTASGIPVGTAYTVVEETSDYTVTINGNANGTIAAGSTAEVEFVNTKMLERGGPTVKKSVEGDGANKDKAFSFTVTLGDSSINGTYGGMTFVNGVASFQLKDGESVTASGIPVGTAYTVVEETSDYTVTINGNANGTIAAGNPVEVEFVNTKMIARGGLTVKKSVEGDGADKNKAFSFTVTLGDSSINGTYGGMTFVSGVASFQLKSGESVTASGIPAGTAYTVVEETSDYTVTINGNANGTIAAGDPVEVEFVNTKMIARGGLQVRKAVSGDDADPEDKFTFTVTLGDSSINGTYDSMTFVNGVATFQLRDREKATATGLPAGITYTVEEAASSYTATVPENAIGTIPAGTTAVVDFINTKTLKRGDLCVRKSVAGDAADPDDLFTFTVTLSDKTISGTYYNMTFVNGVATFQLKAQQQATATGLPAGITYTVEEAASDYTVTIPENATGTIPADSMAVVDFVNTKMLQRGSLQVKKIITGAGADMSKEFTFRVTLSDTSISGTYGDMTFTSGVATFQLGHNEIATAAQLPAGITYTVEELDAGDYKVTSTNSEGTVPANNVTYITFENRFVLEGPATGDDTPLMLYGLMLAMSACMLIALKRKAREA